MVLRRFAFLALVAGCRPDAVRQPPQVLSTPHVQARDSAGVRVVEYGGIATDWPVAFRISEQSSLDLGGAREPPDHELTPGEHNSARLSDGRIVVTERNDLKIFDSQGRYVATLGKRGGGPGEFSYVYGVCVAPGDQIVAIAGHRVSVFASNGEHIRTFAKTGYDFVRFGCLGDGSLLAMSAPRRDPSDPAFRVATARRFALDGSDLGEVGSFPFGVSGPASTYIQTIPNVIPHGNHVYVGDGRRPEIQVYRADGVLTRIVRWSYQQIPVTNALLTTIGNAVLPDLPADERRSRVARVQASGPPAVLPAYAQFRIDDNGRIWVQDYYLGRLLGNFPPGWTVIDSTGHQLGRVILPTIKGSARWIDIRSFEADHAVITWRDTTFGFPHLSFHQITRLR